MAEFSVEQTQQVIDNGMDQAKEIIEDPSKIGGLLDQIAETAKNLPATVGGGLIQIPTLVSMVKSYISKEYTEVSPKVILSIVSAFIYLVSKNDIINDGVPLLGMVDDIAVVGLAMKLCEPELEAFKAWQANHPNQA